MHLVDYSPLSIYLLFSVSSPVHCPKSKFTSQESQMDFSSYLVLLLLSAHVSLVFSRAACSKAGLAKLTTCMLKLFPFVTT